MGNVRPLNGNEVMALAGELGPVIRKMREEKRMPCGELARLAAVDEKTVGHWETGKRIVSNNSLPRVAHALGTVPSATYARAESRLANAARRVERPPARNAGKQVCAPDGAGRFVGDRNVAAPSTPRFAGRRRKLGRNRAASGSFRRGSSRVRRLENRGCAEDGRGAGVGFSRREGSDGGCNTGKGLSLMRGRSSADRRPRHRGHAGRQSVRFKLRPCGCTQFHLFAGRRR